VRRPPPDNLRRVENVIACQKSSGLPVCGKERKCIDSRPDRVIELIPAEVIVRIDQREVLCGEPCEGSSSARRSATK